MSAGTRAAHPRRGVSRMEEAAMAVADTAGGIGIDRDTIARYAELGISRLVLLPNPDVSLADRHRPVPLPQILANLDSVAERLVHA